MAASTIYDHVSLFKRNSAGFYDKFSTVSVPGVPDQVSTDGTWVVVSYISILGQYNSLVFQFDKTGEMVDLLEIPDDPATLTAPNTLVVVTATQLKTYEYNGTDWVMGNISNYGTPNPLYSSYGKQKYRLTENTFIGTYQYESERYCFLMQRHANKSWTLVDSFPIARPSENNPDQLAWNGGETVLVSFLDADVFYVYTRESSGQWNSEAFTTTAVGYSPSSRLGQSVHVLDSNNFLITAPYHIYGGDGTGGAALLMSRDGLGAEWNFVADLGHFSFRQGLFGLGVTANDHDLLFFACVFPPPPGGSAFNCSFLAHPACFLDPIDITCPGPTELSQCSSVAVSDVLAVNNPECGRVSHSVPEFRWSAEGVQFNVTFTRDFVPEVTCPVSLTCPVTDTPSDIAPVSSSVPIAEVATPGSKVNSAPDVAFDALAFVGLTVATFLLV